MSSNDQAGTQFPVAPVACIERVTKCFGPVIGVNEVSLELTPGVMGLLGPNGAGKTTLIKLLIGQLRPDLGQVTICGLSADSAAARQYFGYCPESDHFYEEMSGREFVRTMASLRGFSGYERNLHTERALEEVGMLDRADRRLKGYSKGMRQRIKLAQALVHQPRLLIVDEPLNGVDPVGRQNLMDLFRRLAAQGIAVLVSSHILGEMDELADRIAFMGRGRVLAVGGLSEIRDLFADQPMQVRVTTRDPRLVAAKFVAWPQVLAVRLESSGALNLEVTHQNQFFQRLTESVCRGEVEIESLETTDMTAEATFNYVMQAARRF